MADVPDATPLDQPHAGGETQRASLSPAGGAIGLRRLARDRRQRDEGCGQAPRAACRRWSDDPDLMQQHEHLMVQLSGDLHRIRARAGWSLEDWSRVSGVHPDTIHSLEQARTDPQVSTLIRLLYPAGFTLQVGFRPGAATPKPVLVG